MSTIPLFTISPASMINPSIDMTPSSFPVINKAINPPVNASGIENMMINGESSD